jgi:hypothetical protein
MDVDIAVTTGVSPWLANARAVMQNEHAGWVTSIHETRHGELPGLVMAGPHVTGMVEAGVIAVDAGATAGPSPARWRLTPRCPRRSGAGLVALGRAIDVPGSKPARGRSVRAAT